MAQKISKYQEAKTRIEAHTASILAAVESQSSEVGMGQSSDLQTGVFSVDAGYNEAIQYYKRMKSLFEKNVLSQQGQHYKKQFNQLVNNMFNNADKNSFIKRVNASFNAIFSNSSTGAKKPGFSDDLVMAMIAAALGKDEASYQKILAEIKSDDNAKISRANEFMAKAQQDMNQLKEQSKTYLASELKKLITTQKAVASPTAEEAAFDSTDLVAKIIVPAYNKLLQTLQTEAGGAGSVTKASALSAGLNNYKFAQGFYYEAMVNDALYNGLKNYMQVAHSGAKGKAEDIIIGSKTSSLQDQVLGSLFKLDNKGRIIGYSEKALNNRGKLSQTAMSATQDVFGIQVKNAHLLDLGTAKSRNFATMQKFQRISNQAHLLEEFRSSVPLQHLALSKQLGESYLANLTNGQDLYNYRIAQAIRFLSVSHRIISTMGHLNVSYIDRSGLIWTSDLLTTIKNNKHYLSFQASVDGSMSDFTAAVGIRRFVYTS